MLNFFQLVIDDYETATSLILLFILFVSSILFGDFTNLGIM